MRHAIDFIRASIATPITDQGPCLRPLSEEGRALAAFRALRSNIQDYDFGMSSNCAHAVETLDILGDWQEREGHGRYTYPVRITTPALYTMGTSADDEEVQAAYREMRGATLRKYYAKALHAAEILQFYGRKTWGLIAGEVISREARNSLIITHKLSGAAILAAANTSPEKEYLFMDKWIPKCEGVRIEMVDETVTSIQPLLTIEELRARFR